jgi:hypothetical protein
MAVGDDAEIEAEARRVPAVVFTFHVREPFVMREEQYGSGRKDGQGEVRAEWGVVEVARNGNAGRIEGYVRRIFRNFRRKKAG